MGHLLMLTIRCFLHSIETHAFTCHLTPHFKQTALYLGCRWQCLLGELLIFLATKLHSRPIQWSSLWMELKHWLLLFSWWFSSALEFECCLSGWMVCSLNDPQTHRESSRECYQLDRLCSEFWLRWFGSESDGYSEGDHTMLIANTELVNLYFNMLRAMLLETSDSIKYGLSTYLRYEPANAYIFISFFL